MAYLREEIDGDTTPGRSASTSAAPPSAGWPGGSSPAGWPTRRLAAGARRHRGARPGLRRPARWLLPASAASSPRRHVRGTCSPTTGRLGPRAGAARPLRRRRDDDGRVRRGLQRRGVPPGRRAVPLSRGRRRVSSSASTRSGSLSSAYAGRLADRRGRRRRRPGGLRGRRGRRGRHAARPLPVVVLGLAVMTVGFFAAHRVASELGRHPRPPRRRRHGPGGLAVPVRLLPRVVGVRWRRRDRLGRRRLEPVVLLSLVLVLVGLGLSLALRRMPSLLEPAARSGFRRRLPRHALTPRATRRVLQGAGPARPGRRLA